MVTDLLGKRVRVMGSNDVEHVGTVAAVFVAWEPESRQPVLNFTVVRDGDGKVMRIDPLYDTLYLTDR